MEIIVRDIPEMFSRMMVTMRTEGKEEKSRNGTVLSLQEPLMVRVLSPRNRVLYDRDRCANPFFHVMEFIWMMSGSDNPEWIQQFNSRFAEYADTNGYTTPTIHGAYGHRWRNRFNMDQILTAVRMLRDNPESRRVVLGMWNPELDLGTEHNDLPCNTHIYLRIQHHGIPRLDMTVCNRSNDVIWGMAGANAVHMTMLQELIACELGIGTGHYTVMTNNAHVYKDLPGVGTLLEKTLPVRAVVRTATPLLGFGENIVDFLDECKDFVAGGRRFSNEFLSKTALPMMDTYLGRKHGVMSFMEETMNIQSHDWREACKLWFMWKSR